MNSAKGRIILGLFLVLLAVVGIFAFTGMRQQGEVACTLEALVCPDGSAVGRTGPRCEFAPCPIAAEEDSWLTYADTDAGVTFRYPEKLTTKFAHVLDWPPRVEILKGDFSCTVAGTPAERAGGTEIRTVNGRTYCVTEVTEGAAGSIYTQRAYAREYGEQTVIFTYTTQAVQCANYDEPQKLECENEQKTTDFDSLSDKMFQTLQLSPVQ